MAQRHDVHAEIVFIEPEVHGIDQIEGNMRGMGANHAFGFTGRTGCVDQDPGVLRCHRNLGFGR